MRQRRLKDLELRWQDVQHLCEVKETIHKGKWKNFFEEKMGCDVDDIFLEIGCGKGKFIIEKAGRNANCGFVAIEAQPSVIVLAMEKAKRENLKNLIFLNIHLKDIGEIFDNGELAGIYLNFSDPWHKKRHGKRRLTHRNFLRRYREILNENGFIKMKTDNEALFSFTVEEVLQERMKIDEFSRDLHISPYRFGNIMTEYEEKFSSRGKNINYIKIGM